MDASAHLIVGPHLADGSRALLERLARSPDVWRRRVAVLATLHFIRQGDYRDTLRLALLLRRDGHDLIHKALGWMLREVYKRDPRRTTLKPWRVAGGPGGAEPLKAAAEEGPGGARRLVEDQDIEKMASWLRPLASPVRLRLLRFLTRPHYLEEVASHLKVTRQAARKHLDKLVGIGVLEKRSGIRESGPVTEYLINPQALFLIYDEFEKLGSLRGDERQDVLHRTLAEPGKRVVAEPAQGPCFYIVRGLNTGQRLPLAARDREWTVGRDTRCDFPIPHDPYASNRHAEVHWDGRQFVLTDLRSTNGTHHNWALLPRGGGVALRHGDVVGVGKTLLLFWQGPAGSP